MNYMNQVAQLLDVGLGEEFEITDFDQEFVYSRFKLTEHGLRCFHRSKKRWEYDEFFLQNILSGNYGIIKIAKRSGENFMEDVANLLGIELGEEFKIVDFDSDRYNEFKLTDDGLRHFNKDRNRWEPDEFVLEDLLTGKYEIVKSPTMTLGEALTTSNHIKEIAQLLGLELEEEFELEDLENGLHKKFRFSDRGREGLQQTWGKSNKWIPDFYHMTDVLNGYYGIIKLSGENESPSRKVNIMKDVARLLGVEIGEEFNLKWFGKTRYKFTEDALREFNDDYRTWTDDRMSITDVLTGANKIIKNPTTIEDDVMKAAGMLGVEIGEEFMLDGHGFTKFKFTKNRLKFFDSEFNKWEDASFLIKYILDGTRKIFKPRKLALDED